MPVKEKRFEAVLKKNSIPNGQLIRDKYNLLGRVKFALQNVQQTREKFVKSKHLASDSSLRKSISYS
jgi:hypothetical protein